MRSRSADRALQIAHPTPFSVPDCLLKVSNDRISSEFRDLVAAWQQKIEWANRHNIFCHCRQCDREWVTSSRTDPCTCGSQDVERIACWQFPDG